MTDALQPVIVLNVDDQEAQRYIKTRDLKATGFVAIEARTGAECLRLIEQHRPEVVLLDVKLPDIDGFEVCRYIKRRWPELMVLMTSATFITASYRTLGLDAGADSYLVQPAEPLELAAAINALLRIRRSEDQLRALNAALEKRVEERVAELAAANEKLRAEIAQRQKAEAALVQSQKMEAVGQLTSGLAHDFNNLLTAVVGNLDLIRARAADPRLQRLAENAFKAAERGSRLTSQLLAFSRTQKLATVAVDLNKLISGMGELLDQSAGSGVRIVQDLAVGLPMAMADANQVELAVLNLVINARDAMPEGGTITVSTRLAKNGKEHIEIAVADTGVGMRPEVARRAFDPFFTTKPAGKGTGLGLSQVYGVARQLGGDASLSSELGVGTTVTISLPLATAEALHDHALAAAETLARHSEKLLVVDDDADVRELVSTFLSELGYVVRQAESGVAALAQLSTFEPDLLIVDFAMPGMDGAEFAAQALRRKADRPILFLSGFADSRALEAAVGRAPLLRKPFRPADLATAVHSILTR